MALQLYTRVEVDENSEGKKGPTGKIVGGGFACRYDSNTLSPLHIVLLDEGYYDPFGGYVSLVLVHEDNLIECE
jgi:hypothetical protein